MRRLTDQEGQKLQQIVRRGSTSSVRYRRAMMLPAPRPPACMVIPVWVAARRPAASSSRIRRHRTSNRHHQPGEPMRSQHRLPATYHHTHEVRYFHGCYSVGDDTLWGVNRRRKGRQHAGRAEVDPRRQARRRPHLRDPGQPVHPQGADIRRCALGQPLTRWSLRKLVAYLREAHGRMILIGREALRGLLARRGVTFQRTKTWKESSDSDSEAKLDRIEEILHRFPDSVFAFDKFGPLGIRPTAGSGWAAHRADPGPARLPALAQRQRPPPRPPGRRTQRTRPHPKREGHPLGRTPLNAA
ncbi:hypothetical protein [Streptomyces sp. SP2-10]|uniref:hypothetical protein n=1 Tax=Streptomyces sp. SP2-10 TaxID=2873385 RepID=UPI0035AB99E3